MPKRSFTILQSFTIHCTYLISRMSYKEMKHTALQNIINLERTGKITRQNGYQDLLNSIATDIRTKHRRRITRQNELESTRHTLAQLEEKAEFLKEQLAQYELVIDQNKKTMQTNKGYRPIQYLSYCRSKKTVLPFTKQYFHVRDLQRSGRMPRFGSYKYSATRLVEKGVLVGVQSGRQSEKLHLTISSDDVGVFLMELTSSQYNEDVQSGSEELRLEDLLQLQYIHL
jgi:Ras GTPase-activating-like protein IQGAP2/3